MISFAQKRIAKGGQSTLEFALIVPILIGFLVIIINAFGEHQKETQSDFQNHVKKLKEFEDGNGTITIDGLKYPAKTYLTLDPEDPNLGSFSSALTNNVLQNLSNLGINKLLSNISFLDKSTYISGAIKGGSSAAIGSFVESGYKNVDWELAGWGAMAGAFSSEQATKDFQGKNFTESGFRELVGSGVQSGIVTYAKSEGNFDMALQGAVGGLLGSDTSKDYFDTGSIWRGAAKGAVQGTIAGAFEGKLDSRSIAIAAGLGGFNTTDMADAIPFTGGLKDSRQAASFQSLNSALAKILNGGKAQDALIAAAEGAFYSPQNLAAISGNYNRVEKVEIPSTTEPQTSESKPSTETQPNKDQNSPDFSLEVATSGALFGAGMAWVKGEDGEAVGRGAAQSMATALLQNQTQEYLASLKNNLTKAKNVPDMNQNIQNPELQEQAIQNQKSKLTYFFRDAAQILLYAILLSGVEQ